MKNMQINVSFLVLFVQCGYNIADLKAKLKHLYPMISIIKKTFDPFIAPPPPPTYDTNTLMPV